MSEKQPTSQLLEYRHPNALTWAHRPGSGRKGRRRLGRLSQAAQAFAEEKKKFSDLLSPSSGLHGPLLVVF